MSAFTLLIIVAAAIGLGAMSPGPSFVVVARISISTSRGRGVLAALGMGIGAAFLAILALLGLRVVLEAAPSVYRALQIAGAVYLLFVAYKLWVGAAEPLEWGGEKTFGKSLGKNAFAFGLATQLSNPKTALVYTSVFSTAFPNTPSWTIVAILLLIVFMVEFGWYSLVAMAFSTDRARSFYLSWKAWIDRLAAGAIAILGVRIVANARFG